MVAVSDVLTLLFYFVAASVSSVGAACYESRSELTWLAAGVVIWMITEPIRRSGSRLVSEVSAFALKWGLLAKLCVRRYCRCVRVPAVQGQPLRVKSWKMFEALLATPMDVWKHGRPATTDWTVFSTSGLKLSTSIGVSSWATPQATRT
ncbi:hypothetical protein PF008_g185 [Phytophthora fragariae]|uniref:Secreted protein n=1 Tax=Phytophthora fragariae TaxID=53985 RepID=A0A6G0SQN3_9STRA|nr:hypothetical protein PF008_g185 [Phytophthora fragariae]